MASATEGAQLSPELGDWVGDEVVREFVEAERLARESSGDPPEEPYRSLYAARELLCRVQAKLERCPMEGEEVAVLRGCLQLQIGLNHLGTEELSRGQELLEGSLREVGDCLAR